MKSIFKKILYVGENSLTVSVGLLVLRLIVGGFMMTHGLGKLKMLMAGGEIQFLDPIGMGMELSLTLAVLAEFFASILIILGLGTRLAAFPLLFTMFVAGMIVHAADPFGVKEMALLYGGIYLTLMFAGPGKISVDYWISKVWFEKK